MPPDLLLTYLRQALEWCARMAGAARVILWRIDPAENLIATVASVGGKNPAAQRLAGDPLAWVARERVAMRIEPPPTWSTALRVIALPVDVASQTFVLTLELTDSVPVQPTQFEGLALYVSAVVSAEEERRQLQQQHAHADELIATLRKLPTVLDETALSAELARAAHSIVGGGGAAVSVWEKDHGTVIAVDGDGPKTGATFAASSSETALAGRAGATIVRAALGALPLVVKGERFERRPKALVAVPLKVRDEVIAVLTAWSRAEITEHMLQDLETLAPYAALQLRHAREFDQVRVMAEQDALTGLQNRRAFDSYFAAEAARYERYQRPFAVAMFDIDYFKDVNDRHGHQAGDEVLKEISEVLRRSLRAADFAARYGGEEFVVVMPETHLAEAVEMAERVRRRTEELQIAWQGQAIPVTISGGVAAVPECVSGPDVAVRSADQALYASKKAGRNRITTASTK